VRRNVLVLDQVAQVATPKFWIIFSLAVLSLVPLRVAWLRQWLWAVINVLFLKVILFRREFVLTVAAVFVVYAVVKVVSLKPWRIIATIVLAAGNLTLFLIHKFPALTSSGHPTTMRAVLSAIGFSYVALRMVDLLRSVFEGRHSPPTLPSTINYLVPFHMLAAGPIQSFDDFATQSLAPPALTVHKALHFTERMSWGLFKKFVIASALQKLFLTGFRVHGWYFLIEAQVFYIWLYLDFSGLSDIAVGIGGLLGLQTPENFNHPYLARNMINFWERWHISLSQFIRRHLYIPIQLGLMRQTAGRMPLWCSTVAFTASFALCGLWHAGTLRFLIWGLLNAFGLVVTNFYRHYLTLYLGAKGIKRYLANRSVRILATVVTFEFVVFSLVFIEVPL
jgi:D-alanyl-lipoteichoic acid acyltransferase DltB (MBOAT superfamily)